MTRRRAVASRAAAALAVTAVVASGCGVAGIGEEPGGYAVTVYFERAVAVYEDSQVRVLGLPSGTITDIETEGDRVRVEIRIDDGVALPADVGAQIVPQSLIGERYVQLSPAWTEGTPMLTTDGEAMVPVERTIIPIEPDEAFAEINELLQSLDPEGLGRLIDNAATGLEGNGQNINRALESVTELVDTFADKDAQLVAIIDNFDRFTETLVTREGQLGQVLDSFAGAAATLAAERANLEALLAGLARLSESGLDFVAENSARLRIEIEQLTNLSNTVVANLDSVTQLLDAGPLLADGIIDAYNPTLRALNLRTSLSPVVGGAIDTILQGLLGPLGELLPGVPLPEVPQVCLPIDVVCDPAGGGVASQGTAAPATATATVAPARTPVDDVLDLLGAPRVAVEAPPAPSTADRVADGAGAAGRFVQDAAGALVGAG